MFLDHQLTAMFYCSGLEVRSRVEEFGGSNSDHEHTWELNLGKLQNCQRKIHRLDITRTRTCSCLAYTFEFEKINHNSSDTKIVESLLTYIRIKDSCYRKEIKLNSFLVRCPAQECFKEFVNAFKDADGKLLYFYLSFS